jgi:hypothetical protein
MLTPPGQETLLGRSQAVCPPTSSPLTIFCCKYAAVEAWRAPTQPLLPIYCCKKKPSALRSTVILSIISHISRCIRV